MSTIEDIDLHVRTYRSALKSTLEVSLNSLTNSHLKMESILHPFGNNPNQFDTAAFIYSVFRLPHSIDKTKKLVIAQSPEVFESSGFKSFESWIKVSAPGRRRTCYFNKNTKILAMLIASISDIDDVVNVLIAYQTEWNKFHSLLHTKFSQYNQFKKSLNSKNFFQNFNILESDWNSLKIALGPKWKLRLSRIYKKNTDLHIQLLAGSWVDYVKTTQKWWKTIATTVADKFHISAQEIYFVSSNTHSLMNIFTGFALKNQKKILDHLQKNHPSLYQTWEEIQKKENFLNKNDFLYFAFKFYSDIPKIKEEFIKYQNKLGIINVPSSNYLDINVQLFPIKNFLKSPYLDPRLKISSPKKIANSKALIFNIDYPLGFAAYHVLDETLENVKKIKGIYILSKAAVLNSEIGDIAMPRIVFDEHSQNSYMFKNCFNNFFPFPNDQGSVLTNQKAVSVLGTFLENEALLKKYSENDLTLIEMESGPYLSAVAEATYDQQTPKGTIIDLNSAPFDIGIVNYTSDTPYSKAKNLGAENLGLKGIEPVYLSSLTILQRIINLEEL
jgi:hypothetical protein